MNKVHVTSSLILIGVVLAIFLTLQKDSLFSGAAPSPIPTLPPDNLFLQPNNSQQQQAQDEQQAAAQAQQQAQQAAPPVGVEDPVPASATARLKTSKGTIEMKLFGDKTPQTVRNFISKAKSGFYKNLIFHRVEDWVIQGGDPLGNGSGGGNIPVEFSSDLPFSSGAVGMASRGDGQVQNDSQFFITKVDSPHLNGKYTNFGTVTKGMEVVNKITVGDKILQITIENN